MVAVPSLGMCVTEQTWADVMGHILLVALTRCQQRKLQVRRDFSTSLVQG